VSVCKGRLAPRERKSSARVLDMVETDGGERPGLLATIVGQLPEPEVDNRLNRRREKKTGGVVTMGALIMGLQMRRLSWGRHGQKEKIAAPMRARFKCLMQRAQNRVRQPRKMCTA
jgi:hypothetical protein